MAANDANSSAASAAQHGKPRSGANGRSFSSSSNRKLYCHNILIVYGVGVVRPFWPILLAGAWPGFLPITLVVLVEQSVRCVCLSVSGRYIFMSAEGKAIIFYRCNLFIF